MSEGEEESYLNYFSKSDAYQMRLIGDIINKKKIMNPNLGRFLNEDYLPLIY